jgi:hypothetical protein
MNEEFDIEGAPPPEVSLDELTAYIAGQLQAMPASTRNRLQNLHTTKNVEKLALKTGYDPQDTQDAGWGIMYAPGTPQAVKNELQPLIQRRTGGKAAEYAYPAMSPFDWRKQHGEDFGVVDPKHLPYYFLIVGPPTGIPFSFQFDLDVDHCVGRLYFETAEEYKAYVQRVLDYEDSGAPGQQRTLSLFSTDHDPLTAQSDSMLVSQLEQEFEGRSLKVDGQKLTFHASRTSGAAATKPALSTLLAGQAPRPALVFAAMHGLRPGPGEESQAGALRCQDDAYLEASDVTDAFDPRGLVCFVFACHSAGTPSMKDFGPYLARLPQRLLAQGALAFLGHVGQVWSYSYGWPGIGPLTGTFESAVTGMLMGQRLGHAFDVMDRRYLALFHELLRKKGLDGETGLLEQYLDEEPVDKNLARTWLALRDARAYLLFGDPAAYLRPETMA